MRFLRDGVAQVYCRGYRLPEEGYKISEACMRCMDWSGGEQCQKDYIAAQQEGKAKVLFANENPVDAQR